MNDENDSSAKPEVSFVSDPSLNDEIISKGKKFTARITACESVNDPDDLEHDIFTIDYEYLQDSAKISKQMKFSINAVHISYACDGGLSGVPKTNCSYEDFQKMLSAGNTLNVTALTEPPYEDIVSFNEEVNNIMKYRQIWM